MLRDEADATEADVAMDATSVEHGEDVEATHAVVAEVKFWRSAEDSAMTTRRSTEGEGTSAKKKPKKRPPGWAHAFSVADGASPEERGLQELSLQQLPLDKSSR